MKKVIATNAPDPIERLATMLKKSKGELRARYLALNGEGSWGLAIFGSGGQQTHYQTGATLREAAGKLLGV